MRYPSGLAAKVSTAAGGATKGDEELHRAPMHNLSVLAAWQQGRSASLKDGEP